MSSKTLVVIYVILSIALISCSINSTSKPPNSEILIFAASSLTESLEEISTKFKNGHPNVSLIFNFAGSQQLSTQLLHGAKADIFASADWLQMNKITEAGLAYEKPETFASNRMVVITPLHDAKVLTLQDLVSPGMKIVLAHPNVPAGHYATTVIENLSTRPDVPDEYPDLLRNNVVSEETSVRNVLQKVALGEADAGFVYESDAAIPDVSSKVHLITIPSTYNETATYPITVMRDSQNRKLAEEFITFLRSTESQTILKKYGFLRSVSK
ncbi:MAG: molybdate ABC transporter substrate-binding protein [Chloroflexota bacterium]|nr:molybdate ABC transporter substrate-binding protein [Chloroflexota bacterium]